MYKNAIGSFTLSEIRALAQSDVVKPKTGDDAYTLWAKGTLRNYEDIFRRCQYAPRPGVARDAVRLNFREAYARVFAEVLSR